MNISVIAERKFDDYTQTVNIIARNVEDSNNTRLALHAAVTSFEIIRQSSTDNILFKNVEEIKSPSLREDENVGQKMDIYYHVNIDSESKIYPNSALLFCKNVTIGWEAILTAMDTTFEIMCPGIAIASPNVRVDSIIGIIK